MIRHQVIHLLKLFKDENDLESLSEASRLVHDMQAEENNLSLEKHAFRNEKMSLYLMIINELDSKLIPEFDFNDLPLLSVSPPPESGLPAGVAPSSINDPKLKAEYEKKLRENSNKLNRYTFQKKLMKINQRVTEQIKRYMNSEFSSTNQDVMILNRLIDDIVSHDERRKRLKQYIIEFQHS